MARTKQTARKSVGGAASRLQVKSPSSYSFKNYFVSQQRSGGANITEKNSYIKCDNTFDQFKFIRPSTDQLFQPVVTLCNCNTIRSQGTFMRLDFASCLDGTMNITKKPPLDVVFVIDTSGSMQESFPDDPDRRSKLEVAQNCMMKLIDQLDTNDRVGLVSFTDNPIVLSELIPLSATSAKRSIHEKLNRLKAGGGTRLHEGLSAGFDTARRPSSISVDSTNRQLRVFFLTDMESDQADENNVLETAMNEAKGIHEVNSNEMVIESEQETSVPTLPPKQDMFHWIKSAFGLLPNNSESGLSGQSPATKPCYTTVVGIGVDLSANAVSQLSKIYGAKYISILNAAEFNSSVAESFYYDTTPLAFNIKLQLSSGLAFKKVFGSSELNDVENTNICTISSEFPIPLDDLRQCDGGVYLIELQRANYNGTAPFIRVEWEDPAGNHLSTDVPFQLPTELLPGETFTFGCDAGLRKAIALKNYVDELTSYVTSSNDTATNSAAVVCDKAVYDVLVSLKITELSFLLNDQMSLLPQGTPAPVLAKILTIKRFYSLKQSLLDELAAVNDISLSTNNQNILQTLCQLIQLELDELQGILFKYKRQFNEAVDDSIDIQGFKCPISMSIMNDPVIAADGHSYERNEIERWLQSRDTSPITNLPLAHKNLIPNHALRNAIEQYRETGHHPSTTTERASTSRSRLNIKTPRSRARLTAARTMTMSNSDDEDDE